MTVVNLKEKDRVCFPFCQDLSNKKFHGVDLDNQINIKWALFRLRQAPDVIGGGMGLPNSDDGTGNPVKVPGNYHIEKINTDDWSSLFRKSEKYDVFVAPSDYPNRGGFFHEDKKALIIDLPNELKEQPHLYKHSTFQFCFLKNIIFPTNLSYMNIDENNKIRAEVSVYASPAGTYFIFQSGQIPFKWKLDVRQGIVSWNLITDSIEAIHKTAQGIGSGILKALSLGAIDASKAKKPMEEMTKDLMTGKDGFKSMGLDRERIIRNQELQTQRLFQSTSLTGESMLEPSVFHSSSIQFPYNICGACHKELISCQICKTEESKHIAKNNSQLCDKCYYCSKCKANEAIADRVVNDFVDDNNRGQVLYEGAVCEACIKLVKFKRKSKKNLIKFGTNNIMTKKRSHKLLIVGLMITLTILLIAGISFFSKSNKKENQMERSSSVNAKNSCSNCKKEISTSDKFCSLCDKQINIKGKAEHVSSAQAKTFHNQIKIQKTTSGKYFVNWWFDAVEDKDHSYSEKGKNCFSAEKMPEILALHQNCWENNDWRGWEKELKDNYLLVKEKIKGENGQFQYQTRYESHPTSQADREEEEAEQRIKQAERIREECKKRSRKWKEEHKNEWRTCQKCGKYFCLENEGSIDEFTVRENGGEPEGKIEYFCGECTKK